MRKLRSTSFFYQNNTSYLVHFGRDKSTALALRSVWWPSLTGKADLDEFIRSCPTCQRVKAEHGPPPGLLYPLPVPTRRGGTIGLDFVEMPRASSGHDFLQVHISRLPDGPRLVGAHLEARHGGGGGR